jgi:hypothetical protein
MLVHVSLDCQLAAVGRQLEMAQAAQFLIEEPGAGN